MEAMEPRPSTVGIFFIGGLIALSSLWGPALSLSATRVIPEKQVKPNLIRPLVAGKSALSTRHKPQGQKPSKATSDKGAAAGAQEPSSSTRAPKKSGTHKKSKERAQSAIPGQSQSDIEMNLSHHEILEQPRRYDPGRDRRTGRVLNPQAEELLQDHFLELDRNRDGAIDPFERALGRLDIDRDLNNRQRE
jgi:hypothetical protein